MVAAMTPMQRVGAVLAGRLPDRVPVFLPLTMHGAAEVGLPLGQYYASARAFAAGQAKLRARFGDDMAYSFFYAGIEFQAFGGEVEFYDDGPPNTIGPLLPITAVSGLHPPVVRESLPLTRVLDATEMLAARLGGRVPILGVVMAPYTLPVLQLGFGEYLQALRADPDAVARLLAVNEHFTVEWANAQLAAGATALAYFDPMASSEVVSHDLFARIGLPSMRRTMAQIHGPCITLMASAQSRAVLPDLFSTPAVAVNVGAEDDLATFKAAVSGRVAIIGNLNGLMMRRWSAEQAHAAVAAAIAAAGPGGGYILSDCHGEIPTQVPEDVLLALVDAVAEYGRYPMTDSRPRER